MGFKMRLRYFLCAYFLLCQLLQSESRSSKITFQNGVYDNIVVGLDVNLDVASCREIIAQLQSVFESSSSYLGRTVYGATFGSITLVIPWQWQTQLASCGLTDLNVGDSAYDVYDEADFKVTASHPFARSAPWTKQPGGCGESAEAVFIPTDFLQNSTNFDTATKGRLLLHEWMKLRYGVFEEHGYFDDLVYSPCYTKNKMLFYSSCTSNNGGISPISSAVGNQDIPPEVCKQLVEESTINLRSQLSTRDLSIMFNPYFNNGHLLCTDLTHTGVNPTKQNILCDRKSVSKVISTHTDFSGNGNGKLLNASDAAPRPLHSLPAKESRVVSFRFVMQKNTLSPAYFFVIEDSSESRRFGRLRHVNQAMAEFLRLASDGSLVRVMEYSSLAMIVDNALDEIQRVTIMNTLKDRLEGIARSANNSAEADTGRALRDVFASAIVQINGEPLRKWELVLIVSSPPTAESVAESLQELRPTNIPVSILTFGDTKEWLAFNTIQNTRKIVHLPHCYSQLDGICHGRTSALITDHLLELVNLLKPRTEQQRFFHKVVDVSVSGLTGAGTRFTIPSLVQDSQNFYLFVPVYDEYTEVSIYREGNPQTCTKSYLLEYEGVIIPNCPQFSYSIGDWIVSITGGDPGRRRTHVIRGYVETSGTPRDLKILISYGFKPENEILPRTNHRFPIYAAVTNANDQPIVGANVELSIFYQANGDTIYTANSVRLLDDGVDPDTTRNDGVYSGFLTTFNSAPSFHSGYIGVSTPTGSSSVQGFTNEAALLDPVANSKCCGSSVQFSDSQQAPVEYATYMRVIPSFRTGEAFEEWENIIPPSRIQSRITVIAEDREYITVEFVAPGTDNKVGPVVSRYDVLCTESESVNLENAMRADISTWRCSPVPPNDRQECAISLVDMYDAFYSGQNPELPGDEASVTLYCGIRGIDSLGTAGPLSSFLFEMTLEFEVLDEVKASSNECKTIGDGCLPEWVFWVMIGSIAFLLVLLIIVLICWCVTARKRKPEEREKRKEPERKEEISRPITPVVAPAPSTATAQPVPVTNPPTNFPPAPIPIHNAFINEAYIQETNGTLRLIARDGQFLESNQSTLTRERERDHRRPTSNEPQPVVEPDRSTRFEDRKWVPQPQASKFQERMSPSPEKEDMPIFFTNSSASPAHSNSPIRQKLELQQHENVYSRANSGLLPPRYSHNLRDGDGGRIPVMEEPIPKSRQPREKNTYINPRVSPTNGNMSPIYASVSRTGPNPNANQSIPARRPQSLQQPQHQQHSPPKATPYHVSSTTAFRRPDQFSPSQTPEGFARIPETESGRGRVPLRNVKSAERVSMNPEPISGHQQPPPTPSKIIPLPPVRLDHFPSSESETYSDMSHIVPFSKQPGRTTSATGTAPPSSQTFPRNYSGRNISPIKEQPPPIPKTPPNQNRFGPRRGVRGSANRPQFLPPPPPRGQSQSFDNNAIGAAYRNNSAEDYYDDDSDEWGNYDEQITLPNTGQSFA